MADQPEIRDDGFSRIETTLDRLRDDLQRSHENLVAALTGLHDELGVMQAKLDDLQRRLRLIAGF